jgi:His-Xaa-Ser system protein HxsD
MIYNKPVIKEDGSTEVVVDPTFFGPEAVLNTAYLFTGECYIRLIATSEQGIVIAFTPKRPDVTIEVLVQQFLNELIDQQLRIQIRHDTAEIQRIIVSEAFAPLGTEG